MVGDLTDTTGHRISFCSFMQVVSADSERRHRPCRLTNRYVHRPGHT